MSHKLDDYSFKKVYDFSVESSGTINLGNYFDYNKVTIVLQWTGLNAADATATFVQRAANNIFTTWNEVPTLNVTLATTPGSEELMHSEFGSSEVGLTIAKGSVTAGLLSIAIIAKKTNP